MPVQIIPRASSGPPNFTLDWIDGRLTLTSVTNPTLGYAVFGNLGDFSLGGNNVVCTIDLDGSTGVGANLYDAPGTFVFLGTFTGLQLGLTDCAQLPAIPVGCASYTAGGATTSDTLTCGTKIANAINVSGLTGTPLTTLDFAAVTGFNSNTAPSIDLSNQALTSQTQYDFIANLVVGVITDSVSPGTITFAGTSQGVIINPVNGALITGSPDGAAEGNWVFVAIPGMVSGHLFYWGAAPIDPPSISHDSISLGAPNGDPDVDAPILVTAITAATDLMATASYVAGAFLCTQNGTVVRPQSGGVFGIDLEKRAGLNDDWAVTTGGP